MPKARCLLQAAVAEAVGKDVHHAQQHTLAARMTALLQRRGWPRARAYLPRQDLTEGALEIAVSQGRLEGGGHGVQLASGSTVSTALRRSIADAAIPEAALRSSDLERALLLMNDLADFTARERLERGNEPGISRLVVTADPATALRAQVTLDNFLNRYTGTVRGGVRVSWVNLSGVGDAAGVGLTLSTGHQGLNGSHTRLLTPSGWRLKLAASTLHDSIGQAWKPLDLSGLARSLTVGVNHPLLRSRGTSVWGAADLEARALRDNSSR